MTFTELFFHWEQIKLNGLLAEVITDGSLFLMLGVSMMFVGYLLGSINFAVLISKLRFHDDIRNHGSGNPGFTNMRRTYGTKAAVWVLIGDVGKSLLATALGTYLFGYLFGTMAGFGCVVGHCFPCFFRFRGGKGVAALAGMLFILDPLLFLIVALFGLLVLAGSHYLSMAAVMGAVLYPLLLGTLYNYLHMTLLPALFRTGTEGVTYYVVPFLNGAVTDIPDPTISAHLTMLPAPCQLLAILLAVLIVIRHFSNLKRIAAGQENRFYFRRRPNGTPRPSLHEDEAETGGE